MPAPLQDGEGLPPPTGKHTTRGHSGGGGCAAGAGSDGGGEGAGADDGSRGVEEVGGEAEEAVEAVGV